MMAVMPKSSLLLTEDNIGTYLCGKVITDSREKNVQYVIVFNGTRI
jgi:hypothetical protein